ncbi:MAG: tetratricopeptide repeat protein [bacterium]
MTEPDLAASHYGRGLQCQRAGRLEEAARHYREALKLAPAHSDALHMLGRLLAAARDPAQGIELVRRAIALDPRKPAFHNTLGKLLLAAGRADDAERSFRDALRLADDFAPAHFNLGRLFQRRGDLAGAEGHLRRATSLHPQHAAGWNALGQVLAIVGNGEEAERCFRCVLDLDPRLAEAHHNLGALFERRGDRASARAAYAEALRCKPGMTLALGALGKLLLADGHVQAALRYLTEATRVAPRSAEAWMDLALGQHTIADHPAAIGSLRKALAVAPRHVPALLALGQILHHAQRRVSDAERCYRRALAADPRSARAHLGLAELRQEDEPEDALPLFEHALALDPSLTAIHFALTRLRADLCDWGRREADVAALPDLVDTLGAATLGASPLPPFHLNGFAVPPELHRRAARLMSGHLETRVAELRRPPGGVARRNRRGRLRVGYLSPDFRGHVVGRLIRELFRHHDRDELEVFGYSLVDVRDETRGAIERGMDRFVDVSAISPEAAARRIEADEIDVLVDLGGYSSHTRAEIVALRPAPVQAHWLGYLDTMGASFMPYVIADEVALPEELARHYDEAVVRLPDAFLVSSPFAISERPVTRESVGLPSAAFVYCCFNHPVKIGPECFALWMRILDRVPDSVLWLYDRGLRGVRTNLRREARAAGVDPERIRFAGLAPEPEYLARYALADLFLDTFHWNAGATAIGALRAGVPVVTKPGNTYLSRMGASLCRVAGTPETVCASDGEYLERAVGLACDRAALARVRSKLGDALLETPLFDLARFARHLEDAYRRIWAQHQRGDAPTPIQVPAAPR